MSCNNQSKYWFPNGSSTKLHFYTRHLTSLLNFQKTFLPSITETFWNIIFFTIFSLVLKVVDVCNNSDNYQLLKKSANCYFYFIDLRPILCFPSKLTLSITEFSKSIYFLHFKLVWRVAEVLNISYKYSVLPPLFWWRGKVFLKNYSLGRNDYFCFHGGRGAPHLGKHLPEGTSDFCSTFLFLWFCGLLLRSNKS